MMREVTDTLRSSMVLILDVSAGEIRGVGQ